MLSISFRLTSVAAAVMVLSACATSGTATGPAGNSAAASSATSPTSAASAANGSSTASGAPAARPAADPSAPKPFADIIKGAKEQAGAFPIWRKDDKVWLEIPTAQLGKPFLFTVNIANSVGERGLYASQMGPDWMVEFRKVGNQIQLIAKNTKFRAVSDPALQEVVSQAFSDSLLASSAVASAEHPERKSVLVDASFLLSDIAGYSTRLEGAYRLNYGVDRANSTFVATRADAKGSSLSAKVHFATPRLPAPPLMPSPVPSPTPPQTTPDPRSLFVTFVYNFVPLPEKTMSPRLADPRVGHFAESFSDMSSDTKANTRVHYINRWKLEKKDPSATLSEPVEPIVFWIDKNIPVKYRKAVEAGILEWNKAFERIGFKDAVQAKIQPADADFDNMDATHASIRWFVGADVGFAIGPSHTDPRSGQILDADIGMSDVFARGGRRFFADDAPRLPAFMVGRPGEERLAQCQYAHEAAHEMHFAMDVLEARGDIEPDSPEADEYVNGVIKDTIMHEVGHTLGLKHNFKASTSVTRDQLKDKAYTEANGISASVMDYNATNLPLKGEGKTTIFNTTLGAYDYWAIEYAYKVIDADKQAQELAGIAARSTEPGLLFADDADAGGGPGNDGMDPLANRFDLGDDPLAYYKKRLALTKELWARIQDRTPKSTDDPLRARRSLLAGFQQLGRSTELVGKYVGGMHTLRDLPGTTNRPNFKPVEPAKQREALQFLNQGLFTPDAFKFRPEFLARLSPDYNEWDRGGLVSVPATVLRLQTQALDRLLAPGTAQRLLDLPNYLPEGERKGIISLNEVYQTLNGSIWKELKTGGDIDPMRRSLQREHLRRVVAVLTRGSALPLPADAVSLVRLNAVELQSQLRAAAGRGGSAESRAHVAESLSSLTEALRATMSRS